MLKDVFCKERAGRGGEKKKEERGHHSVPMIRRRGEGSHITDRYTAKTQKNKTVRRGGEKKEGRERGRERDRGKRKRDRESESTILCT